VQLLPCVHALQSMLQLEAYHRARLYAHTLCPSGHYEDLEVTIQAMTSMHTITTSSTSVHTIVGSNECTELDKKDPLKEYLKLLPQVLLHMQSAIVSSCGAVTSTMAVPSIVEFTNTEVSALQYATVNSSSTSSSQSVISSATIATTATTATTAVTATPYVPRFRTFGRTLSTDSTTTTTVKAATTLYQDENGTQQMLSCGSQYSELSQLSQLTNMDFSQSTMPTVPVVDTINTTFSRVPSRQVSERTIETVNIDLTTIASVSVNINKDQRNGTFTEGPICKRLRSTNVSFPIPAIVSTSTTSTTAGKENYLNSSHENAFFDPAQLMYSQDGVSNPFPQYVPHSSTLSKEGRVTSFSSFASVLGKRRNDHTVHRAAPSALSHHPLNSIGVDLVHVPQQTKAILTLSSHLQDLYSIYPIVAPNSIIYTNTTTAPASAAATATQDICVPTLLDHCIAHTKDLPTMRESVRLKYYSVYGRLVTCPPL